MTTDYILFIFLMIIMGIALMPQFKRGMLFIFSDSLIWLWLVFYLINGNAGYWAPWDINHTETYILIMALVMLVFAILFSWMNIEIKHEIRGVGGAKKTYSTYEAPPGGKPNTSTERRKDYRKMLRGRLK